MSKTLLLAAALLAASTVSPMMGAVITYQLTSDHCSGTGGCLGTSTSDGTITVSDVAGGITIAVALNSGVEFNAGGLSADFGFNLAGNPTIAGSSIPADYSLISTTAGSLHMSGTGDFEYGFNALFGNGAAHAKPGPYTFTVTGTGVQATSIEQNALGQYFALDVYNSLTGNTGAVDASLVQACTGCTQSTVPEPSSVLLLGGAIIGMAAGLFKKMKASA